ncbi:MAG: hypothetical protein ABH864_03270 [archaeon]
MKRRYKHKTGVFGTDSERYVSRLLLMMRNRQGDRRPDLISLNGRYSPRLSIEVKSGRKGKGIMVDYQLHYPITTREDYVEFTGEDFPEQEGLLDGVNWSEAAPLLQEGSVAYPYWLVNRIDAITSADLEKPFSSIQLQWGNICSIPHRYAFAAFAAAKANRTRSGQTVTPRELEKIVADMQETIKWDVLHRGSDYDARKDSQSWQNLHSRDFLAIFNGDPSIATKDGQERIRMIRDLYPMAETNTRIEIPGPNGTTIYVMAEPDEVNLFDTQVRPVVEERIPVIEKITRSRARAVKLLDRMPVVSQGFLETGFGTGEAREQTGVSFGISHRQVQYLDRLTHWLGAREAELTPADAAHSSEEDSSFDFGANTKKDQALADVPF